jgi:NhaP-type Na+/H+ or K+/H+ antiporter
MVCFTISFYIVLLFCHQILTIKGWDWAIIAGMCEAVFATAVGSVVSYYTVRFMKLLLRCGILLWRYAAKLKYQYIAPSPILHELLGTAL